MLISYMTNDKKEGKLRNQRSDTDLVGLRVIASKKEMRSENSQTDQNSNSPLFLNNKNKGMTMKNQTKKVTFATLKKLARKTELLHSVRGEHMPYGMQWNGVESFYTTKLEDLDKFKMSKNWLGESEDDNGSKCITLSNCCYVINFYHEEFGSTSLPIRLRRRFMKEYK